MQRSIVTLKLSSCRLIALALITPVIATNAQAIPASRFVRDTVVSPRGEPFLDVPGTRTQHVAIGAFIGALAAASYVWIDASHCVNHGEGPPCDMLVVPISIVFGAGGAIVGGLIGAVLPVSPQAVDANAVT